jgi:hypothetical protein
MACTAGRSVCLGPAKRDCRGRVRALPDEPLGWGLDGLVRAVYVGCGLQLLEVAVSEEPSYEDIVHALRVRLGWILGAHHAGEHAA